jgi:NAD(P) transhydrogenase subunit alpha
VTTTTTGVVRETTPGERRVALVPDVAARLRGAGMEVVIEAGAGEGTRFPDGAYAGAGAAIATASEVYEDPAGPDQGSRQHRGHRDQP